MKEIISNLISSYKIFENLYAFYLLIFKPKNIAHIFKPTFKGWGMATSNYLPWDTNQNDLKKFNRTNDKLIKLINRKKFKLSQFSNMFSSKNKLEFLGELKWRHYIVYTTVQMSLCKNKSKKINLVECGVCDGLTIFFAINACIDQSVNYRVDLFDAWEGMKEDKLLKSEKKYINEYSFLELNQTKKNLLPFGPDNINFIQGVIPEVFKNLKNKSQIDWLHIDLNSCRATLASLEKFWPLVKKGGIVLFDDYALIGYEDTKKSIDKWIKNKNLIFFQFPTGQAMIIKSSRDG